MLNPFANAVREIAVIFAHSRVQPDGSHRIYAVAAQVCEPGGATRSFSTLVAAPRLTAREYAVSGISRKQMADAPGPALASKRLREFLSGQDFFLALDAVGAMTALCSVTGIDRGVDLGFSAEYFIPHLRAYDLKGLWEYLTGSERGKVSFTPSEGLSLAVDLVKHISGHCMSDDHTPHAPALRHFLEKSRTLFGDTWCHLHAHYQDYFGGLFRPSGKGGSENWRMFLEKAEKSERKSTPRASLRRISRESLESRYRGLEQSAPGFTFRSVQADYAAHVAEALSDAAVLTLEAGTGTGKTLGYLLPAMEFLRRNPGERVVISTYTKSLQEQIFHNEVAFVRRTLPIYRDIRVVLLKGKSSYVCIEKLDNLYDESLEGRVLLAWLYCLITAFHFRHTDISTVGERVRQCLDEGQRFSRMLLEVSAGSGCTPSHTRCPAQVVTVQAQAADLVITNHHKLALLDRDPVLADCFDNYIVDEANHFEPAVRNAFGQAVHAREIHAVLDYLERRTRDALAARPPADEALLSRSLDDIRSLRTAAADFRKILLAIDPKAAFGAVQTLPYSHPVFADGEMRSRIEELHAAVESVVRGLKWLKEDDPLRMQAIPPRTRRRMGQHLEQLEEAAATLGSIHDAIVYENNITVYQIFRRHWTVGTLMVHCADLIREQIYNRKKCVVFTAATLCHRNRFDSFQAITGMAPSPTIENAISPREFRFARIPSPFPRDAMEIIVPQDAVSGKYDNKKAWIDAVARALPKLIRRNRGRTLVLFSSYQDLHQVLDKAGADLDDPRYPLLVQRPGQATSRLCEEFRAVKESVLLGVDTFWYGVDFKGDTLTQVVITRIPYPPPGDPVQMGRKHTLPPGEFWERYRYDTDIKMKQGIGRLIRCETDRGRVVVLDTRYRPSL